jgi:uncharacterized protein with PIN domain
MAATCHNCNTPQVYGTVKEPVTNNRGEVVYYQERTASYCPTCYKQRGHEEAAAKLEKARSAR